MYSLSMPAALASTPAPAYLIPAISRSPWIVPSSPKGPCSSGSTTSTSPSSGGTAVGPLNTSPPPLGPAAGVTDTPGVATASTEGLAPDVSASRAGSPEVSTHRPSRVMPIGTTSYRCGSMPPRMSPALAHDTACSLLRPPNTTATRILRAELMRHLRCSAELSSSRYSPLVAAHALQGQVGVADQVLRVLEADREAHGARVDSGGGERPLVKLAVRGGRRVRGDRVRAPERGRGGGQPEPAREREPRLAAAVRGNGDDRAEADPLRARVEQPPGQVVPGMRGQPRVVHVGDGGVLGQRGGEHRRGRALAAHPD